MRSSPHLASGSSLTLTVLVAATLGCAIVGFTTTQYEDRRFVIERHAALQRALAELYAGGGDIDHFTGDQLHLIERYSGLRALRFGVSPITGGGREIQSLQDPQGRIIGWFSWMPDRGLIIMDRLWAFIGVASAALVFCAIGAVLDARRMARALARGAETTRKLASEDALTGLPNQRVMLERLDHLLGEPKGQRREQIVFVVIDLDGFREVKETVGRAGGEDVLRTLAARFRTVLPQQALLGRFGDDEFAVIAAVEDAGAAMGIVGALRASLSTPIVAGQVPAEQACHLSGCIGVALAPEDGTSAEQLARRAALAARAAKKDGRGVTRRFTFEIESNHSDRHFLLRELKAAISAEAFEVHYQPIVAAAGGAIIGVEALSRWNHAERGAIEPSKFISIAEQHGLMKELGAFVLRRALADAVRWPALFVAINLSPVQIHDPLLIELVGRIMAQIGIEPSRVVLEMTEGVLVDDPQEILVRLEALRALGIRLALDDFGTGYSSLSYLQKFPFHRLKIDRAFVEPLGTTGNAGAIVHSIVTLGHALGMAVLAEGVETDQQRVLLRLAGCDEMQGYLFGKPQPAEAIDNIATRRVASRGARERKAAVVS
ncbi:MAG: putative bifunctional diguanylate cyclase/phosphodiesterase [Xanthobacteraceae bacterium]